MRTPPSKPSGASAPPLVPVSRPLVDKRGLVERVGPEAFDAVMEYAAQVCENTWTSDGEQSATNSNAFAKIFRDEKVGRGSA